MSTLFALAAAWAIAFLINIVPAFMPPTWSVLAVFHVTTGVPLVVLTVGGAAASAGGRVLLALGSRKLSRWLPETDRRNAESLGAFVCRHGRWRDPIVFLYCLGPLPSNPLFIAAGVGRVPLLRVTIAFFLSRSIADTFWVWAAGRVSKSLTGTLFGQLTDWRAIAIQIAAIGVLVLVFRLPWAEWLGAPGGPASKEGGRAAQKPNAKPASASR